MSCDQELVGADRFASGFKLSADPAIFGVGRDIEWKDLEPAQNGFDLPQSNGMAEAFVRTLKRDYARVNPRPNAQSVIDQLPGWFAHYNEVHPHRALRYQSPREFIAQTCEALSGL
ncbi:integrase-like protein [Sphingomonas sp. PP-CC-3A-396]|nr:integrase-like protein [Sphingomonas sp. PP-CC-3A-396]